MLAIIEDVHAGLPWREAVGQRYAVRNPWLHRVVTDPRRDLFFRVNPPPDGSRVLDIGAGWGQVALPLAQRGFVCALEPTPERLGFIRAAARQERLTDRMWFLQADLLDLAFEPVFDLVCCIGVLEWVPKFAPHLAPMDAQLTFLRQARAALRQGGRLVVGIENRLGLKYLLGAPDDHLDRAGIGTYDLELASRRWKEAGGGSLPAVTYTRAEYTELLTRAGFSEIRFWTSFPDYKLPDHIVPWGAETDRLLESYSTIEHDGIRGEPLPFQDELRSHYRSLARLGIGSDFAPSFFIEASTG